MSKKRRRTPHTTANRPAGRSIRSEPGTGFRKFPLLIEPVAPPSWPPISVCMIVKDEAHNLRPCIGSLGDLASEIVVVDTGSTDDTVRVATELGARVFHFPWVDDFSAARNESLRHATGEWVFWVDADDRLGPRAVAQLKSAAASGKADAYMCRVVSRESDGKRSTVDHARLFRNGLGISFSNAIHETVWARLVALGLRLAATEIQIEHTGYETMEALRQKSLRNLPIISREIESHPELPELIYYRGNGRTNIGDLNGAEDDFRAFLQRTQPGGLLHDMRIWALSTLIYIVESRRGLPPIESLVDQALAEAADHPHFLFCHGKLQMLQGRHSEAIGKLLASHRNLDRPVAGIRPPTQQVELTIADCYRSLGSRLEALRWAKQVYAHTPDWETCTILLGRLLLETGDITGAQAVLDSGVAPPRTVEHWLAVLELRAAEGRWEEADQALEAARQLGLSAVRAEELSARLKTAMRRQSDAANASVLPSSSLHRNQGLALLSEGDSLRAAELFARAIEAAPSDPENYRYLAVALRKLGREEEAVQAWRLSIQQERVLNAD